MDLPFEVIEKIEDSLSGYKLNDLKVVASTIRDRYQNEARKDNSIIDDELFSKVYAAYRMPATFGACIDALKHTIEVFNEPINSIIDVGGGTGASSLALSSTFLFGKITAIEKSKSMYEFGKFLTSEYANISWANKDIKEVEIEGDLIFASYMLNELKDEDLIPVIEKLWKMARKSLIIVESGDKKGSAIIQKVRDYLLDKGDIIAPCPHANKCPMKIDDWCHFSTRIQRGKIQRIIKEGESPFEDEKYSYIAFSKIPVKESLTGY